MLWIVELVERTFLSGPFYPTENGLVTYVGVIYLPKHLARTVGSEISCVLQHNWLHCEYWHLNSCPASVHLFSRFITVTLLLYLFHWHSNRWIHWRALLNMQKLESVPKGSWLYVTIAYTISRMSLPGDRVLCALLQQKLEEVFANKRYTETWKDSLKSKSCSSINFWRDLLLREHTERTALFSIGNANVASCTGISAFAESVRSTLYSSFFSHHISQQFEVVRLVHSSAQTACWRPFLTSTEQVDTQ